MTDENKFLLCLGGALCATLVIKGILEALGERDGEPGEGLGRISHGYRKVGRIKQGVAHAAHSDLVRPADKAMREWVHQHVDEEHEEQWRRVGVDPRRAILNTVRHFDYIRKGGENKNKEEEEKKEKDRKPGDSVPVGKSIVLGRKGAHFDTLVALQPFVDVDDRGKMCYVVSTAIPTTNKLSADKVLWDRKPNHIRSKN